MQESPALYSKLINSLDGIVWEADGETFQFKFVSPQAERILGYPIEQWLQPNFWMNHQRTAQVAPFAELLLAHGAHVNVRASLRKQLHPGYDEFTMHEYRNVTALSWGQRFHRKVFVSEPAMRLIAERGGLP